MGSILVPLARPSFIATSITPLGTTVALPLRLTIPTATIRLALGAWTLVATRLLLAWLVCLTTPLAFRGNRTGLDLCRILTVLTPVTSTATAATATLNRLAILTDGRRLGRHAVLTLRARSRHFGLGFAYLFVDFDRSILMDRPGFSPRRRGTRMLYRIDRRRSSNRPIAQLRPSRNVQQVVLAPIANRGTLG
jgi:hypothetical protein